MSELISGKEAKLAWAEGVTVQVATGANSFRTLVSSDDLGIFDRGNYFRLKPRTITINGIEVLAPFEPKVGEIYWCFSTQTCIGYGHNIYESKEQDGRFVNLGAWRTEEEIKQVIATLRSVFNTK